MAKSFYLAVGPDFAERYDTRAAARNLIGGFEATEVLLMIQAAKGGYTADPVHETLAAEWWQDAVNARIIREGSGTIDMVPIAYRETLSDELAEAMGEGV